MDWDALDIKGAIEAGFSYIELKDEIVGFVYTRPPLMKKIIISMPEEVEFDFIPEGIGMIRTAYFKMLSSVRDNEIKFVNQQETILLKIFLI